MVYESKAALLASTVHGSAGVGLDPITIGLAIELFREIVALYRHCHRPAAMAAENMNKPGIVTRRRLRKLIEARQLPQGVSVKQMHTAVLEVGKSVTEAEVVEMYAAVGASA